MEKKKKGGFFQRMGGLNWEGAMKEMSGVSTATGKHEKKHKRKKTSRKHAKRGSPGGREIIIRY